MTRFVRSIFAKRNPRNVPLDIYDTGGPLPFPRPSEDPSGKHVSHDEWMVRAGANKEHLERLYASADDRRAAAREEYTAILAEIVRGIGETAHRIQISGALHSPLDGRQWVKLGRDLASLFRDAAASLFIDHLLAHDLFLFEKTAKFSIGKERATDVTAEQLRNAFEERVVLIERWIAARAAFEAREEIRADRALHPSKWIVSPQQGIDQAIKYAAKVQAGIIASGIPPRSRARGSIFLHLAQIYFGITDALQILRDSKLRNAADEFLRTPVRTLQSEVKKAERLAAKGEAPVSRKLAREAAIREGDELKQNPFLRAIIGYP
jgi:hypothetical protein